MRTAKFTIVLCVLKIPSRRLFRAAIVADNRVFQANTKSYSVR